MCVQRFYLFNRNIKQMFLSFVFKWKSLPGINQMFYFWCRKLMIQLILNTYITISRTQFLHKFLFWRLKTAKNIFFVSPLRLWDRISWNLYQKEKRFLLYPKENINILHKNFEQKSPSLTVWKLRKFSIISQMIHK